MLQSVLGSLVGAAAAVALFGLVPVLIGQRTVVGRDCQRTDKTFRFPSPTAHPYIYQNTYIHVDAKAVNSNPTCVRKCVCVKPDLLGAPHALCGAPLPSSLSPSARAAPSAAAHGACGLSRAGAPPAPTCPCSPGKTGESCQELSRNPKVTHPTPLMSASGKGKSTVYSVTGKSTVYSVTGNCTVNVMTEQ